VLRRFGGELLLRHDEEELPVFHGFDLDSEFFGEEGFDDGLELGGDRHVEAVVLVAWLALGKALSTGPAVDLDQRCLSRSNWL
jgi:hypothetical protein